MPTFEYRCPNCNKVREVFFKQGEEIPEEIICDNCSIPDPEKPINIMAKKIISKTYINPKGSSQELQF